TAATIDAVTTGVTIVLVCPSSQTAPTIIPVTPTSSHDVIPRSRSQPGVAKTPLSAPASTSYSDSSFGRPRWVRIAGGCTSSRGRASPGSGERTDGAGDDEAEQGERDRRLHEHRVLGAVRERHHVRRAERR